MSIKIDLKIFLFLFLFLLTSQIEIYIILMIFAILHEIGHLIAGLILKFKETDEKKCIVFMLDVRVLIGICCLWRQ